MPSCVYDLSNLGKNKKSTLQKQSCTVFFVLFVLLIWQGGRLTLESNTYNSVSKSNSVLEVFCFN